MNKMTILFQLLYLAIQFLYVSIGVGCTHSSVAQTEKEIPIIVYIILSQPNTYHAREATLLKQSIVGQSEELEEPKTPIIYLLHQEWPEPGSWTIFPILSKLVQLHGENVSWVFIGEDYTKIRLPQLLNILRNYNSSQDWFLGHSLYDNDATIIHHFAFYDNPGSFAYPDFAAGCLFSMNLLKKLSDEWESNPDYLDFSIDAKYELALYMMEHVGVNLTHVPELCVKESNECATYPKESLPTCGSPASLSEIYFAVKTCEKFHLDRVPVVKETWARNLSEVGYFSDANDPNIPSIVLNVTNTERGHCAKTFAILEYVAMSPDISQQKSWIIIADDDTLLSISRLRQLLSCYDAVDSIALGERYGYAVTSNKGYNYITGGGGIVLSMAVVKQLVDSGLCICPTDDTPDDMFIGICLKRLGIPIIHSALFHQARPVDYAKGYLSHQIPVSFHKHWMIDPIKVYKEWLQDENGSGITSHLHMEL